MQRFNPSKAVDVQAILSRRLVTTETPETPVCGACGGIGWIVDRETNPSELHECEVCGMIRSNRRERLALSSEIPALFRDAQLATIKPPTALTATAVRLAQKWLAAWTPTARSSILLYGPVGSLKSTLAVALLHAFIERAEIRSAVYVAVPDLLAHIRESYDHDAGIVRPSVRLEYLASVDLLVADDLGAEKTTPWVIEELYRLFGRRHDEIRTTIITTNLKPGDGAGSIRAAYGERVSSRVVGMARPHLVEMDAADARLGASRGR